MLRTSFAVALLLAAPAAFSQDAAARHLAASCAICHGTGGRSVTPEIASLAGMPRETLAQRLREFRDGRRQATVMHQLAKGYSDSEIDRLAAWFSVQPK